MSDLPHLLTRIESAEKADRELDFAVALASGLYQLQEPEGGREEGDTTQYVRYVHPIYKTVWSGSIGACVPEITASVDAALALVERMLPGWAWRIEYWPGQSAKVDLWERGADGWHSYPMVSLQHVRGKTPALAILAALLKALLAKGDGHE